MGLISAVVDRVLYFCKPVGHFAMSRPTGIEQIIHKQRDVAGNWVAGAQKANNVMVKSVGFGIGADGHANGAVGSGFAPEFVAGFHIALPLDGSAYIFLFTEFNGGRRTVVGAFFTNLTEVLYPEVYRLVFD